MEARRDIPQSWPRYLDPTGVNRSCDDRLRGGLGGLEFAVLKSGCEMEL